MIVEINYTALQWDNHQGGSGKPITGRKLLELSETEELGNLESIARVEIGHLEQENKSIIGDYRLVNIVIDL